jgi:NADH-quinone oxidoreductase subunit H
MHGGSGNNRVWLEGLLLSWGLPVGLVSVILAAIGVVVLCVFVLIIDIVLVWVERKVVARFQDRLGPNRLGPFGLIQPIADVIKLLIKEDIFPAATRLSAILPYYCPSNGLLLWAVIPIASTIWKQFGVGVLYIGYRSNQYFGHHHGGLASNNKYALIGAFRTVARWYRMKSVGYYHAIPVILLPDGSATEAQSVWFVVMAPLQR